MTAMGSAEAGFRLSPQQQRLARAGGLSAVVTIRIEVTGDIDDDALIRAAEGLVHRHEALRTRFVAMGGGGPLLQVIDDAILDGGPVRILQSGARRRFVEISASPLCLDLRSADVLAADLALLYGGGVPSEAPQYADIAEWFHGELEMAGEAARLHWSERRPPAADPPTDGRGSTSTAVLKGRGDELAALADRSGITREALIIAVWDTVLRRSALIDAPVLGVGRPGRRFAELEFVVGPVEAVAWIAVRHLEKSSLLEAARALDQELVAGDAVLEALPDEARLPFGGLRWVPNWAVHTSGDLAFQVERVDAFELPFDAHLRATPSGPDLEVTVTATGDRLDPSVDATVLVQRFEQLLAAAIATPSRPLRDFEILTAADRRSAIERLNPRAGAPSPTTTIVEDVNDHAREDPTAIALVAGPALLTRGELVDRSRQLAERLVADGAEAEEVIAIVADLSVPWLVAVLGAWRAGCACLCLDASVPPVRAAEQCDSAGVRRALVAPGHDLGLPGVRVIELSADGALAQGATTAVDRREREARPDHLAFVTFTSGTTGRPKGVAVEHRNLAAYSRAAADVLDAPVGATFASPAAPSADLGMTAWLVALAVGGTIVAVPASAGLDADAFATVMSTGRVDVLKVTPSHLEALLAAAGPAVLPRRTLVLGGERVSSKLIGKIQKEAAALRILNHYGPTETTVGALVQPLDHLPSPTGDVPIGHALASAFAVPGGDGPLPGGSVCGELWLGGPSVARGYLGDPRTTADRFRPDPTGTLHGGRSYRTGDLVRLTESGAAVFVGREDDQVKIRGARVELAEVERALQEQSDVAGAVVLTTEDPGGNLQLEAWVTPADVDRAAILQSIVDRLPQALIPTRLHAIDALPRTAGGKPDRAALLAMRTAVRAPASAPSSEIELTIAEILSDLLEVPVVDAEASFFELGGHSLLATRAIARLRSTLGLSVDVETFFVAPTVAALAALAGPDVIERARVLALVAQMSDEDVALALEAE